MTLLKRTISYSIWRYRVLQKFFEFVNPRRVFLSVRSDNEIAKKFYLKNNMKLVGTTSWARGTLPGDVYLYETS